ncbi:MAG: hypothetical protein J4431_03195 [Candidatus Aenigmarchaeota archaeon]|nr:hypothetical protein [Candidatus Aenigmarchaeota archaeon]
MDDFHPLIERINGLEAKLRNTFMQIDQRLGELETIKTESSEQRLQEIEDLMLLLQVENTKIQNAIGKKGDSSFLDASFMPDDAKLQEKVDMLEQQMRGMKLGAPASYGSELETRINHLENRLDELSRKGLSGNDEIAEMGHELKDIRTGDGGDVEKRLAALEEKIASADSSGSVMPEDFGRRIRELEEKIRSLGETRPVKELEESVSNMQSYVKERLEAIDPSRMSDMVTKKGLQEYVNKLSAAREAIGQDMEKMAAMKNDIDIIASMKKELEEKLSRQSAGGDNGSMLLEKIQTAERRLDEKLGEIDALSRRMDSKLADAGEKLSAGNGHGGAELESRFGRMEKTIEAAEQRYNHAGSSVEKNLQVIKELAEQIEEESISRVSLEKNFQDMKSKIDKISVMNKELEKERRAVKEMAESTSLKNSEMDKKLDGLQKKIGLINELRRDIDEESVSRASMEKGMQEFYSMKNELGRDKEEIRKLLENNQLRSGEMEKAMREIKDIGDVKKLAKAGEAYTANVEKRVKDLEAHIQHIARLKMELENESVKRLADEKVISDIKRRFSSIEARVEKFATVPSEMQAMLAAVEHLRHNADSEAEARASLEQGINEMRQKLQGMETAWKGIDAGAAPAIGPAFMDKITGMQKRLDGIERKAAENPSAAGYAMAGNELNAHLADFSNQMNALRGRLMQESSEFSQFMKQNDINQFRKEMKEHHKMLRSIDKKIEKSAMRFFAENLEDFAKALDRRMPAMVTREAYDRDMKALAEKLGKIEAPESAALYERMDSLERDIGRTIVAMRSMMSRVPVVVE